MKLAALLPLAALLGCTESNPPPHPAGKGPDWARSESVGEAMAHIVHERRRLGEVKQDVEHKLATATDAAERERLLAEQRTVDEELRKLDEWEKSARARR